MWITLNNKNNNMFRQATLPYPLKAIFEKSIEPDKIQFSQIVSILSALLFAVTAFADAWVIPSLSIELYLFRWVVMGSLIATFIVSYLYPSFFLKHYNKIKTVEFLLAGALIELFIYHSKSSDLAYYIYFSGLIIVFMILYSWTHIKLSNLIFITVLIIAGYVVSILMREDQGPHGAMALLIPTLIVLGASICIGISGKIVRDDQLCQRFLLQQSYKSSYKEKEAEAEKYEYRSNHDQLTGLPNRRYVDMYLDKQIAKLQQHNESLVIMFIDLNGFKQVNDDYGHSAGDEILKATAKRLKLCLNKDDCIVRLGGDEFLISLCVQYDKTIIESITERIKKVVKEPILFEGNILSITASIGVANSLESGTHIPDIISLADKRMYQEKELQRSTMASLAC